ncbi:MAG: CpaF family protein [Candidatus Micrarchaeota archaeon]
MRSSFMTYFESLVKKAREKLPEGENADSRLKGEDEGRVLIDSYGDVKIYKDKSEAFLVYEIPSPHYKGGERDLINTLVKIAAGVMPPDVASLSEEEKRRRYYNKVVEIIDKTPELNVPVHAKDFYATAVVREMAGYSLIDALVADDGLEEIMILGPGKPVYVFHRKYEMMKTNVVFYYDEDIRNLIERIGRAVGRRIDTQVPLLDARLPDGTRVNATIPPVSIDGSTITLRKFRKDPFSVVDLLNFNTLDVSTAAFLWLATDGLGAYPANVLIAGGTASGKTTTLNVLCSFVPNNERIVTIEDTAELSLPLEHWIRMEVRPPSLEGTGEIGMNDLVKNSIRMRPDRIIVGEIRGEEGYTMFAAMNTGHRGVMGTVHANSAQETLVRLASPPINVPRIMLSSLNLIIMQNRIHDRRLGTIRRITEIAEVVSTDVDKPEIQVTHSWDPVKDKIFTTGVSSTYEELLKKYTGLNDDGIKAELAERENILRQLSQSGIRLTSEVCKITQNYVLRKKLSI